MIINLDCIHSVYFFNDTCLLVEPFGITSKVLIYKDNRFIRIQSNDYEKEKIGFAIHYWDQSEYFKASQIVSLLHQYGIMNTHFVETVNMKSHDSILHNA